MAQASRFRYFALVFALVAPAFAQQQFDSADSAVQALIEATEKHDVARLNTIFGPPGSPSLTSGNAAQDKQERSEFSRIAREKHQLLQDPRDPNRMILSLGDEDWPFPVPLVRSNGKWSFDASQTQTEMQARRIGSNELDAIEICAGYVDAQRKYASEDRAKAGLPEYASHMISAPDRGDGLYQAGASEPLVPHDFAQAVRDERNKNPKPYHGYYFRLLGGQGPHATGGAHTYLAKSKLSGGFGLMAWPARYGVTGIRTFIVNQEGVVYEKDIPSAAGGGVPSITRFDPDPSWTPVE
jgi:hypothetical protein